VPASRGDGDGDRLKVLYIIGFDRSGSTILANILGEVDGFTHPGELRRLWELELRAPAHKAKCGCGVHVQNCPYWAAVLQSAFGGIGKGRPVDPAEVFRWQQRELREIHVPRLVARHPGQVMSRKSLRGYADVATRLYRAVAEVSGARLIIDSSKWPGDAALLNLLPDVEPYFLHLVRDPRGAVNSRYRKMRQERGRASMLRMAYDATRWASINLEAIAIGRRDGRPRMQLHYEDFVAQPRETVDAILRLVGEEAAESPFVDDRTVVLRPNHTVSGNGSRFRTGVTPINKDSGWESEMSRAERLLVTTLSYPALRYYGYPVSMSS
jgi:hypothetical protein